MKQLENNKRVFFLALILALNILALGHLKAGAPFHNDLPPFEPRSQADGLLCFKPLSVNKAREEELILIPGVGPRLAQAIVSLREKKGKIKDLSELLAIKGLGPRKLSRLEAYLKVP
ncbi:ComEA family DNA-binding protein [Thermosulfuriphilus sp.]